MATEQSPLKSSKITRYKSTDVTKFNDSSEESSNESSSIPYEELQDDSSESLEGLYKDNDLNSGVKSSECYLHMASCLNEVFERVLCCCDSTNPNHELKITTNDDYELIEIIPIPKHYISLTCDKLVVYIEGSMSYKVINPYKSIFAIKELDRLILSAMKSASVIETLFALRTYIGDSNRPLCEIKETVIQYSSNVIETSVLYYDVIATNIKNHMNDFMGDYGVEVLNINIKDIIFIEKYTDDVSNNII